MIDTCYIGDVRDGLRAFIAAGIRARTCVTSPPYWGLRDYGVAGQLGLESSLDEYIATMVEVFRLVRQALTDDGCIWVNMGDSYAGGGRGGNPEDSVFQKQATNVGSLVPPSPLGAGMKPKDLMGMPWRLAFALQADGWWLRQDIIWHKPNPMPESAKDRCTTAHEYVFLLSKRARYYFDADAIAEARASQGCWPLAGWASGHTPYTAIAHSRDKGNARTFRGGGKYTNGQQFTSQPVKNESAGNVPAEKESRNKRSVWTIPAEPFRGAHFATFPQALVRPCVLAGSAPGDTVLDPFMGCGTTAKVAMSLGRHWIGCELNPEYVKMQSERAVQYGMELSEPGAN